jgi:hypothetical protein
MRGILPAAAILIAAATSAAAGPWARGEGNTFLSLAYELTVDPDDPYLRLNHEILVYGERGLTPRLTLVLDGALDISDSMAGDVFTGIEGDGHTLIGALNFSLAAPDAAHQFALLGGLGKTSDAGGSETYPVLGASWGRGFETPWGGGWTTVEAQYRAADAYRALSKLDMTLGIRPGEKSLFYGQLRLANSPGSEPTARLATNLVLEMTSTLKAELGLLYGLSNDDMVGLRSGIWLEF